MVIWKAPLNARLLTSGVAPAGAGIGTARESPTKKLPAPEMFPAIFR